MRILFVHNRFGALAGAETNAHITAAELKQHGHIVGIIHGPSTGRAELAWQRTFTQRFSLNRQGNVNRIKAALEIFQPDLVYVHKMDDLEVIETLIDSKIPLVRMVHDHDIRCRGLLAHPRDEAVVVAGTLRPEARFGGRGDLIPEG